MRTKATEQKSKVQYNLPESTLRDLKIFALVGKTNQPKLLYGLSTKLRREIEGDMAAGDPPQPKGGFTMYKRLIEALKLALSEAEKISGSGDRWTEEIKEILDGVRRSEKAAEYEERYKLLFLKHIPAEAEACFVFFDPETLTPSEIMIEKGYICRRYPFDEKTPEKSIKEAAAKWRLVDISEEIDVGEKKAVV